jgi:hydrogenase maturation protease
MTLSKSEIQRSKIRYVGIGDPSRRDSAAGPATLRQLTLLNPGIEAIECAGDGMMILDLLAESENIYLIGAVSTGGGPGSFVRFDINSEPLPSRLLYASRHLFSVSEALELSRTFNRLPARCILYGIVGADFSRGEGMNREVRRACETVAHTILKEVHEYV